VCLFCHECKATQPSLRPRWSGTDVVQGLGRCCSQPRRERPWPKANIVAAAEKYLQMRGDLVWVRQLLMHARMHRSAGLNHGRVSCNKYTKSQLCGYKSVHGCVGVWVQVLLPHLRMPNGHGLRAWRLRCNPAGSVPRSTQPDQGLLMVWSGLAVPMRRHPPRCTENIPRVIRRGSGHHEHRGMLSKWKQAHGY